MPATNDDIYNLLTAVKTTTDKFLFDGDNNVKAAAQSLPETVPLGYGPGGVVAGDPLNILGSPVWSTSLLSNPHFESASGTTVVITVSGSVGPYRVLDNTALGLEIGFRSVGSVASVVYHATTRHEDGTASLVVGDDITLTAGSYELWIRISGVGDTVETMLNRTVRVY